MSQTLTKTVMEENSINNNIADYNYIDEKLFITKSEDQMSIILA